LPDSASGAIKSQQTILYSMLLEVLSRCWHCTTISPLYVCVCRTRMVSAVRCLECWLHHIRAVHRIHTVSG